MDAPVGTTTALGKDLRPRDALGGRASTFDDSGEGLTGPGEGLALPKVNVQQPLPPSGNGQPQGLSLAVVKDMRHLVNDEVLERLVSNEGLGRNIAGCLLAQAEDRGGVGPQQFGADAGQVQVREIPSRPMKGHALDQRDDVGGRDENDRALDTGEDRVLLYLRKEAAHHRLQLARGQPMALFGRGEVGLIGALTSPQHLGDTGAAQVRVGLAASLRRAALCGSKAHHEQMTRWPHPRRLAALQRLTRRSAAQAGRLLDVGGRGA